MSDFFPGPGWWLASDGKWYEPSTHPDPNRRAAFTVANDDEVQDEDVDQDVVLDLTEAAVEPAVSEEVVVEASQTVTSEPAKIANAPQSELKPASMNSASVAAHQREKVSSASSGSTGWIADMSVLGNTGLAEPEANESLSAEERAEVLKAKDMADRRIRLERARRSAEALRGRTAPIPVVETEEKDDEEESAHQPAHMAAPLAGRTKLEIDGAATSSEGHKFVNFAGSPVSIPTTTALVHVPRADKPAVDPVDRLLAFLLFSCGIAMVLGAFMEWTTGPTTEIGWDRADGIVVVIAGTIAAAAAGPMYGGLYAVWARATAITAGVVGLMGVGVVTVTTLTEMELTGKTIGTGVYVVGTATLGAIVASFAASKHHH